MSAIDSSGLGSLCHPIPTESASTLPLSDVMPIYQASCGNITIMLLSEQPQRILESGICRDAEVFLYGTKLSWSIQLSRLGVHATRQIIGFHPFLSSQDNEPAT